MNKISTCAIWLFIFSSSLSAEVGRIKVWSPDFKEVKIIEDQNKIASILKLWSDTEIELNHSIEPLTHGKLYKIDFKGSLKSINGRWLYSKNGYYRLLSKKPQKIFKVKNVSKLNQKLGI